MGCYRLLWEKSGFTDADFIEWQRMRVGAGPSAPQARGTRGLSESEMDYGICRSSR